MPSDIVVDTTRCRLELERSRLEEESAGEGTLATLSLDEGRVAWSSQTTRNSRVHGSWGDIYDEEIKKSMEYEVDPDSFWAYMIPKVGLASIN